MNICFLSGKIVSTPEFKFVLNRKHKMRRKYHICIMLTEIKIDEKTIIKLKFYDEIAEFAYKTLNVNDSIIVYGTINGSYEIEVDGCFKTKLNKNTKRKAK